jgi:ATPase subunit of ABC transporter with duplicated ATPase domains
MINLQNIMYQHPNKDILFENICMSVENHNKIALIGNNGIGKSTLLRIIAGETMASSGVITMNDKAYYVPQIFGQFDELTIAQALGIAEKLTALHNILNGIEAEKNMEILNDDWSIEERCFEAMASWNMEQFDLSDKLENLSGGEKTKIFLAGININQPALILLDEPSNHLDLLSRNKLYDFIKNCNSTLIVVSHDRILLNLLETVCELTNMGISTYGGNYDFYIEQKQIERNSLGNDIRNKEKELRKAKEIERETIERRNRLDSRGKNKSFKEGLAKAMRDKMKNDAENSTARLTNTHTDKKSKISNELSELRKDLPKNDSMKFVFDNSNLHKGKKIFSAKKINISYVTDSNDKYLWKNSIDIEIFSGDRIAIKGNNGAGKTTLIKIILGTLVPQKGMIESSSPNCVFIDQDYSAINNNRTIYEQAQAYNLTKLEEHEVKIRLFRFLFTKDDWHKKCKDLSGGERIRLMLCCLFIYNIAPDVIILDEPTNNLDIQNVSILASVIREYEGTLLVISHDEKFLEEINIKQTLVLE